MKVEPGVVRVTCSISSSRRSQSQAFELDRARLARDWNGAFNALRKFTKYSTDPVPELIVKGTAAVSVANSHERKKASSYLSRPEPLTRRTTRRPSLCLQRPWRCTNMIQCVGAFEATLIDLQEANAFLGMICAATGDEKTALNYLRACAWTDPSALSPWEARVALLAIELRGALQQRCGDPEAALASYFLFFETLAKVAKVRSRPLPRSSKSSSLIVDTPT